MENKTVYDLLEKLYIEVQDMKSNMATKDDIANMATKDDIANMATKDDIANMATKDDIASLRKDMNLLGDELHKEIESVYVEVKELRNDLNTMEILTTKNAYDIAKLKAVK